MSRQRASIVVSLAAVVALGGVGSIPVAAAEEPAYFLPAPESTNLVVTQGNNPGAGRADGRTSAERYAFDFGADGGPQRFPVLAARGGTVMGQRLNVRGGRCARPPENRRPNCWRDVNYVLIDHGDGTSGLYMHLRNGEPEVRTGRVVSAGQAIGTAGSSGWTDQVGVQFQLQTTPVWSDVGAAGWFQTRSLPVSFSDPDVLAQQPDGVPQSDDLVISGNPGSSFAPFRFRRRPTGLPANVPFESGVERAISAAYDADSPDGYGLHFAPEFELPQPDSFDPSAPLADADPTETAEPAATIGPVEPDPGTAVRPLFGGELAFAGCATGESAGLGRTVVTRFDVDGASYLGVLGHLSDIDPLLVDLDPSEPAPSVSADAVVGHYGAILGEGEIATLDCPEARSGSGDLFAAIIRNANVTPEGEISGGTPVSPEPLVGRRGYEGLSWWSGPLNSASLASSVGRPRANWNGKTTAQASHVPFGDEVRLTARVRDRVDIAEVRFRVWYPEWPRLRPSAELDGFDPASTWQQLAVCRPRGASGRSDCAWEGNRRDALVTYTWDPTAADLAAAEAWLPRARTAMSRAVDACVPVSMGIEVIDTAGNVRTDLSNLPRPTRCDQRAAERASGARLVYLDPIAPPAAPTVRKGVQNDRGWPAVYQPDPLKGAVVWRDRSDNEDGFRIYARRSWLKADCSVVDGPWSIVTEVGADRERYRPNHKQVVKSIKVPKIPNVPGSMNQWEYSVAAFNEVGTTKRVPIGVFLGGSEAFCDLGLEPPPGLQ